MRIDEFDFELPPERIAQAAPAHRGSSRLLRLDRRSGAVDHGAFAAVAGLLRAGDLLVVNDTRVIPARLHGVRPTGGAVEVLLVEPTGQNRWHCLLRASRGPRPGETLTFPHGLDAEVVEVAGGEATLRFRAAGGTVADLLEEVGRMPLPPYIRREAGDGLEADDRRRYQTVYARIPGAVAAPTAGLHFTQALLDRIEQSGVRLGALTLHVGPGTFRPVRVENVEDHKMHSERYELSPALAQAVDETRAAGGRVVAVGTTVVRTLEGCAGTGGRVVAGAGRCDLFIRPGFRFRVVDAMITNFHLPRSTLLMLVCAFAGREAVLAAYREAIRSEYRFYSYGDAMWIG